MSIYRRGDVWWYRIQLDGGKLKRASCKTTDEQKAQEYHDRKKAELWDQKRLGIKPRRTWAETSKKWLKKREQEARDRIQADLLELVREEKQLRTDKQSIDFWTAAFSRKKVEYLDQITPEMVEQIRDEEYARPKQRGGGQRAPGTVNRQITTLRAVINCAARVWQWLDTAPPLFEKLGGERERVRWLTPEDIDRLGRALPEPYSSMVWFACATGLRLGNITTLRWQFLDMQKRKVTLPHVLMKNGAPFSAPLNEMALTVLRRQLGRNQTFVFVREDGEQINEIPSRTWKRALEVAGIKDFRFHDTRHTFASLLRQHGVGLDRLQELGGWKDASMVQRYAHLDVSHLAESAAVLDSVFARPVQTLHSVA